MNNRRNTLLKIFVLVLASLLVVIMGSRPWPEPATTENVSAAYSKDGEVVEAYPLPLSAMPYFVCGDLQAKQPVSFQIDVFDAKGTVVGYGDIRTEISPGKFCLEIIPVSEELDIGSYNVEIIEGHDVIGATTFVIGDR